MIGAVPPGTLSARLDELAEAGVLERRIVDARPPRTEYVLTDRGQRVSAVLDDLLRRAGNEAHGRARLPPPGSIQVMRTVFPGEAWRTSFLRLAADETASRRTT